jgi:hypothetical protein
MHKLAGAAMAALAALTLSSCIVHRPGTHTLAEPDSTQPAAGICLDVQAGAVATFSLDFDTPDPRCGKVRADQRLRVLNTTGSSITVTFDGSDYRLQPSDSLTFTETFGEMWQPGVHDLHTSLYDGGGPEIWLVADE